MADELMQHDGEAQTCSTEKNGRRHSCWESFATGKVSSGQQGFPVAFITAGQVAVIPCWISFIVTKMKDQHRIIL